MFGNKRKARKIQVADDNDDEQVAPVPGLGLGFGLEKAPTADANNDASAASPAPIKFARRPHYKASSLRKSIYVNDEKQVSGAQYAFNADDHNDAAQEPVVIRPQITRHGFSKPKKKSSPPKLSFGLSDYAEGSKNSEPIFAPRKATFSQKTGESNALRSSLFGRLPPRSFGASQDNRPSYSKEYLLELQYSTPHHTPPTSLDIADNKDGAMDLDASELEGAIIVPSTKVEIFLASNTAKSTHIPSAAEIQEKKERRARLALEGDAYKEDSGDYISLLPRKTKDDTRLIAEDEDLGEGYDEFVEDGRLELGRKGEREARRRHRREMAELINTAEAGSDNANESDNSDAEREAAYEAAQTRAAMDGRRRPQELEKCEYDGPAGLIMPRIKPLPELGDCLARLRALVYGMEEQVVEKRRRVETLEKEKGEILAREKEVQEVLNQAGARYQAAMGVVGKMDTESLIKSQSQTPLRTQISTSERGLESFGTTPTTRADLGEE